MRVATVLGSAVMTAVASMATLASPPTAHATNFGVELRGTYSVRSDGEWARTNDVLFDQATDAQIWTADTNCISVLECVGTITSDKGWTGTARLDDYWYIEHDVPNWAPCPDGTFATGHQQFIIMGWNRTTEEREINVDFLMGRNVTKTDSGACGRNHPLVIELPVSVRRIS
jgi:hypothetical protein